MLHRRSTPSPFAALFWLGAFALSGGCQKSSPPVPPPALPDEVRALSPAALPDAPPDVTNRFADAPPARALGQRLFFDPGFSGALLESDNDGSPDTLGTKGQTGRVACAGCHLPASGFLDNRSLGKQASLAAGWTQRRTPSLLDVGQSKVLHWDGRHDTLWNQIFGPLEHANEMNTSRLFVAEQVFQRYRAEYEALFGPLPPLDDTARFPPLDAARSGCVIRPGAVLICHGVPGDGAEYDGLSAADQRAVTQVVVNLGKAIAAYERLLSCGPSRFDAWVQGDSAALDAGEQRGALLFAGKAGCTKCHSGPYLSDEKFHNVGMMPVVVSVIVDDRGDRGAATGLPAAALDPLSAKGSFSDGDDGRLPASVGAEAEGAFRTPKLRCSSRRPSFMHTGQVRTLEEVVAFFDRGGDPAGYPGKSELTALGLSAQDRQDLVAFLRALDGPGPAAALLK